MILKRFTVGALSTNCYVVGCAEAKEALIIDPGFDTNTEAEKVLGEVDRHGLQVRCIVNTHGHPDHTSGNGILREATGAPILIHKYDAPMLGVPPKGLLQTLGFNAPSPPADRILSDGDTVWVGSRAFRVLHTPGHSRGSISLLGSGLIFTGDTLFAGSIGRTDLPGSSHEEIMRSLKDKLIALPDQVRVYPGHGSSSTMGREKRLNPFLLALLASENDPPEKTKRG